MPTAVNLELGEQLVAISKKTKQRFDLMIEYTKKYGCEYGYTYTISFHDLAYNLNNTWHAKYFVTEREYKKHFGGTTRHGNKWAMPQHALNCFYRPFRDALKKYQNYPFEHRVGTTNEIEYLVLTERSY